MYKKEGSRIRLTRKQTQKVDSQWKVGLQLVQVSIVQHLRPPSQHHILERTGWTTMSCCRVDDGWLQDTWEAVSQGSEEFRSGESSSNSYLYVERHQVKHSTHSHCFQTAAAQKNASCGTNLEVPPWSSLDITGHDYWPTPTPRHPRLTRTSLVCTPFNHHLLILCWSFPMQKKRLSQNVPPTH